MNGLAERAECSTGCVRAADACIRGKDLLHLHFVALQVPWARRWITAAETDEGDTVTPRPFPLIVSHGVLHIRKLGVALPDGPESQGEACAGLATGPCGMVGEEAMHVALETKFVPLPSATPMQTACLTWPTSVSMNSKRR